MDSGLLPTDACQADVRGTSRIMTVTVAAGTAPTEECNVHVFRDYCTEGKCLATDHCPAESVMQVAVLDHVREDYGPEITADDDPYLLANLEKALEPTEPTEENPEGTPGGCPVHNGMTVVDPEDPNAWLDPSDPNYIPPDPDAPDHGWEPVTPPAEPTEPDVPPTPTEPVEPEPSDPSGGFGDAGGDWWNDLWNTPAA